jgi:alkanesulfonate monooxygenase SsuD/methylene tetrahydromethanopterin reductase-like flavin-dependent oxidoreductase (luciferase family)
VPVVGVIFSPDLPPERLVPVARAADAAGVEQLWLWEDCFAESGIAAAAAVLGCTRELSVGIGLLPVPLRNVALTAMELATLERLFPGRLVPGIGHGVAGWMDQVGEKVASPMTLLTEYTDALRRLLGGERVTVSGRYVQLRDVQLAWPPQPAPRLLVGAVGDRTAQLARDLADGVILTGGTSPERVREVTGLGGGGDVVVFVAVDAALRPEAVARRVAEYSAAGATHVALLSVGDDGPPLEEHVGVVAAVRRLVD